MAPNQTSLGPDLQCASGRPDIQWSSRLLYGIDGTSLEEKGEFWSNKEEMVMSMVVLSHMVPKCQLKEKITGYDKRCLQEMFEGEIVGCKIGLYPRSQVGAKSEEKGKVKVGNKVKEVVPTIVTQVTTDLVANRRNKEVIVPIEWKDGNTRKFEHQSEETTRSEILEQRPKSREGKWTLLQNVLDTTGTTYELVFRVPNVSHAEKRHDQHHEEEQSNASQSKRLRMQGSRKGIRNWN
ncbi:hypothetical protein OSB04_019705 [Centaurea solstitialis]|uniref:Uncharacterized protein n=1 Tax=Centaurea solstitialis TaxID=347529 RepID=A0AA38W359_9ASTR|nr:hypothetical protein OSB04_019705 [Centaurea solstitialis]